MNVWLLIKEIIEIAYYCSGIGGIIFIIWKWQENRNDKIKKLEQQEEAFSTLQNDLDAFLEIMENKKCYLRVDVGQILKGAISVSSINDYDNLLKLLESEKAVVEELLDNLNELALYIVEEKKFVEMRTELSSFFSSTLIYIIENKYFTKFRYRNLYTLICKNYDISKFNTKQLKRGI